ncbi:hypothetical protein [Microbacterium stercoris]|uniref:Uncharacterized protein n=1 Tax=Microbacterium stercoris TaxID=2820289 RepID=A0A939QLM2_9MICO|nr:hypothetical protein [Microbacterium stercoris]MBO3662498.1 hypothetical protein [Microbacterium stercoris]MBO3664490.1 hypothetical protein [Microbacterium stercoris]
MPQLRARPGAPDPPAETARSASTSAPLTDAYRPIRRISPPEAPLDGVLAAVGERRVLLADAAMAADGVFAARGQPPQHLLTPRDVVRRADGHDLELPWCRERVTRLLDARSAQGRPLAGGEIVTLAVSVLRGTCEAWDDIGPEGEPMPGRWWLDDEGRPLFAPMPDGGQIAREAADLLEQAAAHTRDRVMLRLLGQAREALQRPRRLWRLIGPLEDALLEAFASRGIEQPDARPARRAMLDEPEVGAREAFRPPPRGALTAMSESFAGAALADLLGETLDRVRGAVRRVATGRSEGGRRVPLMVGAAVAAVVLGGGLLWPTDVQPADARSPGRGGRSAAPGTTAPAVPTPAPTQTPTQRPTAHREDARAAGERLRRAIVDCAAHGDPLCEVVREPGAEAIDDGVLAALAEAGTTQLLDDYGDVAVLRADGPEGRSALLQIVRLDGHWMLRGAQLLPAG